MKLLPSLRQKKRYVVFEVKSSKPFSFSEIKEEVEAALLLFWGQLGLSRASPIIIAEKYHPETQRFIIKVNHKYTDELKAALTLIKKIKNTPVIVRSINTSGILKKASAYSMK